MTDIPASNRIQARLKQAVSKNSITPSESQLLDVTDDKTDARNSVSSDDASGSSNNVVSNSNQTEKLVAPKKLGPMASFLRREKEQELDLSNCFQEIPELADDGDFHEFVEAFGRNPALSKMVKRINEFVIDMTSPRLYLTLQSNVANQDSSTRIQAFLEAMHQWMDPALIPELGQDFTEEKQLKILAGLESYLTVKLKARCMQPTLEDKLEDDALQFRIALLNAANVGMKQLGIPDSMMEAVEKMVRRGGFELLKIDLVKSPSGKSRAILGFNNAVIELLQGFLEKNDAVNADILLPAIIYTLVRINPPRMVSNLRFVQRFRYHGFQRAQEAYASTNLDAAVHFLQTCDLDRYDIPGELSAKCQKTPAIFSIDQEKDSVSESRESVDQSEEVEGKVLVDGIEQMVLEKVPEKIPAKLSTTIKGFMDSWKRRDV